VGHVDLSGGQAQQNKGENAREGGETPCLERGSGISSRAALTCSILSMGTSMIKMTGNRSQGSYVHKQRVLGKKIKNRPKKLADGLRGRSRGLQSRFVRHPREGGGLDVRREYPSSSPLPLPGLTHHPSEVSQAG